MSSAAGSPAAPRHDGLILASTGKRGSIRFRAGLIGCDFYASNHLNAWCDVGEEVELITVCDLDSEKARAVADAFEVRSRRDLAGNAWLGRPV